MPTLKATFIADSKSLTAAIARAQSDGNRWAASLQEQGMRLDELNRRLADTRPMDAYATRLAAMRSNLRAAFADAGTELGLGAARAAPQTANRQPQEAGGGAAGLASQIGWGAVVAGATRAAQQFGETSRAILNNARAAGINAEEYQRLSFAAREVHVSQQDLDVALRTLQKTIGDPNPEERKTQAIRRLGLSWEELRAMTPEAQFDAVAKALAAVTNHSERAALATKLLGDSGAKLVPMIAQLDALKARADVFGQSALEAGERFASAWEKAKVGWFMTVGNSMDIIGKGYQTAGALSAGVGPMQYFGEEARNNAAEAGYQASLARVKAIAERKAQAEQAAEAAREQAAAEAAAAAESAKAWENALIKRNRLAMVDGDAAGADATARALSLGQSGVAALGGGDLDVGMRMIEREAQAKASAAKAAADATAKAEIAAAKAAESAAREAAERKAEAERKINNLIQQRTAILADQARRRSEDIARARAAAAVEALDARRAQILGENPRERLRDQVAGFAERKKAQKETEKDDQDYKRKIAELEERRARGQRISAKGTDMLAQADAFRAANRAAAAIDAKKAAIERETAAKLDRQIGELTKINEALAANLRAA